MQDLSLISKKINGIRGQKINALDNSFGIIFNAESENSVSFMCWDS